MTSCIDIKFLQKVKHCTQWYHYGNKIDVGITNDNDCAQNTKKLADQASEDRWYGYIYDVNILEENIFFSRIFHRIQQPISKLRIPNFHELFTNHIVCDEKTMTMRCIKFVLIGQKFRENLDLVVGSSEQDIPNSF